MPLFAAVYDRDAAFGSETTGRDGVFGLPSAEVKRMSGVFDPNRRPTGPRVFRNEEERIAWEQNPLNRSPKKAIDGDGDENPAREKSSNKSGNRAWTTGGVALPVSIWCVAVAIVALAYVLNQKTEKYSYHWDIYWCLRVNKETGRIEKSTPNGWVFYDAPQ